MFTPEVIQLGREGIPALAAQVVGNLASLGYPRTVRQNLEEFLNALHAEPSVSTVALVSVPREIPGPRLDIYALWGHPVDLVLDRESMARVVSNHYRMLGIPLTQIISDRKHYGTFIYTVALQTYPSAESLRDRLVQKYGAGSSAGVITVASLTRS